jgi:hypothetical protein
MIPAARRRVELAIDQAKAGRYVILDNRKRFR